MGKFAWEEKEKIEVESVRGMEISQEDVSDYQSEELSERRSEDSDGEQMEAPAEAAEAAPAEAGGETSADAPAEATPAEGPAEVPAAPIEPKSAAPERKRHVSVLAVGLGIFGGVMVLGLALILGILMMEQAAEVERLNAQLEYLENREGLSEGDVEIDIPNLHEDTVDLVMVSDALRAHGQCEELIGVMDYAINFDGHELDLILVYLESGPVLESSMGCVADYILIDRTTGKVTDYRNYHFPENVNISPATHDAAVEIIYWAFSCRSSDVEWSSQIWAEFEHRRVWEQSEIDAVYNILEGDADFAMVCDAVWNHGQCDGLVAAMDYSINFEGHRLDLILLKVNADPMLENSVGVEADYILIDKDTLRVMDYSNCHYPDDLNASPQTHEEAAAIVYWHFSHKSSEWEWGSQIWTDFENRRNWEESEIAAVNALLSGNMSSQETLPAVNFSGNAQQLQEQISTIAEVAAFMDAKFPELMMYAHATDGIVDYWWLDSGERIVQRENYACVGRGCVVNAATFLLCDDMEIYTVIGFRHDQYGGIPMMAINCIKTEEGYQFIDPVRLMRGDMMSRYGALLPEATVGSIEEYIELICSDREICNTLEFLYFFENGERFEFYEDPSGCVRLKSPDREPVYHNSALTVSAAEYHAMKFANVKPENIGNYRLSRMLGGTTLTVEEAYALVDAEPEEVKEKVKTAADVLMYMLAAQIGDNGGCYCDNWGGYTWHSNYTAETVMEKRLSNCGASANLANYLLEGDYEEIGFINHAYYPGNGGGHVYNYIKYQGEYYIVDYSWYIFANYETGNDFPVMKLRSLDQFGEAVHELYGGVSLVIAYTSPGQHLPNIFGEEYGEPYYYVPEGAEYAVLYQSGDGYLIAEKYLDRSFHDWTVF